MGMRKRDAEQAAKDARTLFPHNQRSKWKINLWNTGYGFTFNLTNGPITVTREPGEGKFRATYEWEHPPQGAGPYSGYVGQLAESRHAHPAEAVALVVAKVRDYYAAQANSALKCDRFFESAGL